MTSAETITCHNEQTDEKRRVDNQIIQGMRPLFFTLKIFGIYETSHSPSRTMKRWLPLCFYFIYFLHSVIGRLPHDLVMGSLDTLLQKCGYALRILFSCLCVAIYKRRRLEIDSLLNDMNQFYGIVPIREFRKLKCHCTILATMGWMFLVTRVTLSMYYAGLADARDYASAFLYNINIAEESALLLTVFKVIIFVDWFLYNICLAPMLFMVYHFVSLCLFFRLKLELFTECLKPYVESTTDGTCPDQNIIKKDIELGELSICHDTKKELPYVNHQQRNDLLKTCILHSKLCVLGRNFDSTFTTIVFLCYAAIITDTLIYIPIFVSSFDKLKSLGSVSQPFTVLNNILLFFIMSVSAFRVSEKATDQAVLALTTSCQLTIDDIPTIQLNRSLIMACTDLDIKLTGWRCFTISRGFVLTVVSSVFTFGVIIYQFMTQQND